MLGLVAGGLLAMTVAVHAASPGEMRIDAPSGTQEIGKPFEVRVSITRADAPWAVYTDQVIYDRKVLRANSIKPAGIADCRDGSSWASPQLSPTVLAACAFQETQATGVTEIIEFECVKDGSTALHFVTLAEDESNGSGLLDYNASPIATDLIDSSVTCGAGGPIETVPVPTNPPPPTDYFVSPGHTPPPNPETPGVTSSEVAGGTPGAGATSGGTATGPGASTSPGPAATRAAATGTAAASKTSTAQNATQGSGDSGMPAWLIAVIVVVVLGAAGGAGWLVLKRRGGATGG